MNQTSHVPETFEEQAIELTDAMYERACELPTIDRDDAVMAMAEAAGDAASVACVLFAIAGAEDVTGDTHDMLMDCAKNASGAAINTMRAVRYFAPKDEMPTVRAEHVTIADLHEKPKEAEAIDMAGVLNRLECMDDMLGDVLRDLNAWDRDVPSNDPAYYVVTVKNELLRLIWSVEKSVAA